MNMSVENNMLHLLCQTKLRKGHPMLFRFFSWNFFKTNLKRLKTVKT